MPTGVDQLVSRTRPSSLSTLQATHFALTPHSFLSPLTTSSPQLLFINRCYWPDSEATGQLLTDLCEHLSGSFEVHVVCGQPNSPTEDFQPRGMEQRGGVTIHRLAHSQFAKRIPAGRLMNLVSFSRAASSYLRRSRLRSDILISETDPFLLPIVAEKHARRTGAKLICYLQDIYPDVAEAIGKVKSGWFTRRIRNRLQRTYQSADRIVVLGDCMRNRLRASPWSIPMENMDVIPNWADSESIQPLAIDENPFREREGLQNRFIVMHSGNMGLTQRLDVLVRATAEPEWPENAVLLLIGDGASRQSLVKQASLDTSARRDSVRFLGYQPREQLSESLSAADLHVVSMHENISGCLCPSKLYGILAAGRPVLAVAGESTDLHQTVNAHRLGWCCVPGDAGGIARAVADAASNAGRRQEAGKLARDVACSHFDRQVVTRKFAEMIRELLSVPSDSRRLSTAN